tara:strand:+ start:6525 stop:6680 length:156 start_codon:yes stop_codon:yes gene_type:complete
MQVGDLVRDRSRANRVGIIIRLDSFGLMWHILYSDGEVMCSNGGFLEVVCK